MTFGEKFPWAASGTAHEAEPGPAPSCVVLGLGNCLLQDDGIGVHAVRALMESPPAGACVLEVGTDVFSAVPWLEKASRVLAIDAMDAGGQPGDIFHFSSHEVNAQVPRTSLHEMGLLSVLEFVPKYKWPEIAILGVQPAVINYGLGLSEPLLKVLPKVVQAAREIVAALKRGKG